MSNPGRSSTKYRSINFSGHHAHIIEIARSCRNEEKFTDVIFQCSNGKVFAHRLVLASCSSFMSQLFLSLPQGLSEYMIIIPNIRKEIVEILLNFIYTGEMMLSKKTQNPLGPSKKDTSVSSPRISCKRRISLDNTSTHSLPPTKVIIRGQARTRGRPTRTGGLTRTSVMANSSESEATKPTGFHDMMNVETWICAICEEYDPNIANADQSTTEWIGCDCNRWYHQFCTKLKVLDKNFNCAHVNLECLPT
ncbi:unnamed protein product [Lepeophtheirus salmonis]|uniref:(salmon louse) hypothetical protein n=1 Tax=Lepeophtheirus salmonis TaxID=72036 RepID=A0A7R8CL64_LEPSM|nr:unnamed protein product [Lepeophtheirus salmonis]CAF2851640.1 unnamed protein product [Lepeophtheirus salmonis]